jgi:hypothetical protein
LNYYASKMAPEEIVEELAKARRIWDRSHLPTREAGT